MERRDDWAWLAACVALAAAGGCGAAHGRAEADDAGRDDSGSPDADASTEAGTGDGDTEAGDADTPVDDEVDVRGWRSVAFEHDGLVPEEDADPALLDACSPYLRAAAGRETYWVWSASEADLLPLFPWTSPMPAVALVRARGSLSPPGSYGPMGGYERELLLSSSEVLVCETVARLGHCVVPREGDICPDDFISSRETRLVLHVPGPAGATFYEARVALDPDVADGTTIVTARFSLPMARDPSPEWAVFEMPELGDVELTVELAGEAYERVLLTDDLDGWVMRNAELAALRISLSGSSPEPSPSTGRPVTAHLWGYFPLDETVYYP